MGFVLDASVYSGIEHFRRADGAGLGLAVLLQAESCRSTCFVADPGMQWLLIAERSLRTGREETLALLDDLAALPITIYPPTIEQRDVVHLARDHKLTAYDATYLHLALTLGLDIATFDEALANAASRAGVRVL